MDQWIDNFAAAYDVLNGFASFSILSGLTKVVGSTLLICDFLSQTETCDITSYILQHCKWIPFIEGLRYLNTIFHRIQTVNTSVILSGQGCSRNDQTDSTKYWEGDQAIDQVIA